MKRTLLLMILLASGLSFSNLAAQEIKVCGYVSLEPDDEKASFANVRTTNLRDSTDVRTTIADLNGEYVLENVPQERYVLEISYSGYEPLCDTIEVRLPSAGNAMTRNYKLKPSSNLLQNIVVTGSSVRQEIDKSIHIITKSDLRNALHSLDLIKVVPQLHLDPVSQKISAALGGNVKILINGANASETELKSLDAELVKNIEYYDFPPARYSDYAAVVNFVTRRPEDGLSIGVDLQHAVTTRFANDGAFVKYNKGRHQLMLNYNLYYRDYKRVESESRYEYSIAGVDHTLVQNSDKLFGYTDNYINLSYVNQLQDKYLFQATFMPNFMNSHNDGTSNSTKITGGVATERKGEFTTKTSQFSPALDMYYWRRFGNNQELDVNLVGTYFRAENNYANKEWLIPGNQTVIDDFQNTDNDKSSLIAEASYALLYETGYVAIGNRFMWEHLTSSVDNSFNTDKTATTQITNYGYVETSGRLNKWSYRMSLGGTYLGNESDYQTGNDFILRIDALAGYRIGQNMLLRAGFEQSELKPSLGQLSDNIRYVSEDIISTGNPYLKRGYVNETFIGTYYNTRALSYYAALSYSYSKNAINSYFVEEPPFIVLKYENTRSSINYGFSYGFHAKLFKDDLITLNFDGNFINRKIHSDLVGTYEYLSTPFTYSITFNYKNFTAFYQGNIVYDRLNGPYLSSAEKRSNLGVRYNRNNMTFSVTCMWFLNDAKYKTRTVDGSLVSYNFCNNIRDNASMVTLGFSYRFSTAKRATDVQKNIYNRDTDSGL